jgi:two-component system chemotaxis response regulator CheB
VEALTRLVRGLPAGLPAVVYVVCHVPGGLRSVLPEILSRNGKLLASHARDGEQAHYGHIYVAPPDHHLVLEEGVTRLSRAARENGHRPAIDPLFRAAARVYGRRAAGVILTGSLNDGVAGLLAVRSAGGLAVVQDPAEAAVAAMPESALQIAGADHVLPLADIPDLLTRLVQEPPAAQGDTTMADPLEKLPERVNGDMAAQRDGQRRGHLTVYTCPECGGAMWQADGEALTQFRCHVGHAYYGEHLLAEQTEALEAALWTAVRTFKEKNVLGSQLAAQERQRGNARAAERFEDEARLAERYAGLIQEHILKAGAAETGAEPLPEEKPGTGP